MNNNQKITWAGIIPLIGGMCLGAQQATKNKPEYILSWKAFDKNDEILMNYYSQKEYDIKRYVLDDGIPENISKVDIMVATPPCAGLSMLNSGKSKDKKRGGCAIQNEWIYRSMDICFSPQVDCKVLIIENAPNLYTDAGIEVLENIKNKAKEHNRSVTFVKTSTIKHGIPQDRIRSFTFLWKNSNCPILEFEDKPYENITDYLKQVNETMVNYSDEFSFDENRMNKFLYEYIVKKLGKDFRAIIFNNKAKTVLDYVVKNNLLDDVIINCSDENLIKKFNHVKHKLSLGMGYWDSTTKIMYNYINALIGKNIKSYVHPTEDRLLNIRECLHLMGFPHDFYANKKNVWMIPQNVPTKTAEWAVRNAIKFLNNELEISEYNYMKINNLKQKIDLQKIV